jgi:hypothetical protein
VPQPEDKSIPTVINELKELTINYAKQETIDPLKQTGRFVAYGVGGSFVLGLGLAMIGLALLRVLQTHTGSKLQGHWSWAPYLIMTVVLGGIAAVTFLQIKKDGKGTEQ